MTADSGAASSGPYANKDAGPSQIPLRSSGRPSFRMCICPLCYTAGAWPAQDNGGLPPPGFRLEQKRSGAALPEGSSLHQFRGLFVTKRIFLNFCLHSFPLSSRSLRVRRGGGIGRHAVLRWQWLRRASSTLALDTMTIRGCILRDAAFFVPFRKRPFCPENRQENVRHSVKFHKKTCRAARSVSFFRESGLSRFLTLGYILNISRVCLSAAEAPQRPAAGPHSSSATGASR